MASYQLSCLALPIILMYLTFFIVTPGFALDLWLAIVRVFERRRSERLARKSRQHAEKMKKYWVIDMRKLR